MTQSEELDNCPFCKCSARVDWMRDQAFYVVCKNKQCGVKTRTFSLLKDAIAAWNTRPPLEHIEGLEHVLAQYAQEKRRDFKYPHWETIFKAAKLYADNMEER